jgi:hypothetical protein
MEQTFRDAVGEIFDSAETIDYKTGETPDGEYTFARISGVDGDVQEKIRQLKKKGYNGVFTHSSIGPAVETWSHERSF